ncbi:MAG: hypothetical protein WCP58_05640 [bacterium]
MIKLGDFLFTSEFSYDETGLEEKQRVILEAFVRYHFPSAKDGNTETPNQLGECTLVDQYARDGHTYLEHSPFYSYLVKCEGQNYLVDITLGFPRSTVSIRPA